MGATENEKNWLAEKQMKPQIPLCVREERGKK